MGLPRSQRSARCPAAGMSRDSGTVSHATTRKGRGAVHRGPGRPPGRRGARRRALPPERGLGVGRVARGGRLLRPIGLSHHRPAARGARARGGHRAGTLLAAARTPSAARALGDAGGGHPLDRLPGSLPARRDPRRAARRPPLLQQLVVRVPARLVLRQLRSTLTTRAPLVAGGRGAVLPGVAAAPHPRPPLRAPAVAAGGAGDRGRARLRVGHGRALPARQRPHPCLRGHRHPRLPAAHRCLARHRVAEPPVDGASAGASAPGPRRPGWAGAGRHRRHGDGHQRVPDPPLPRRDGDPLPGDRGGDRRPGSPGGAARPDPRSPAAALDRRALLRDLPLALPDHRAHHPRRQHPRAGAGAAPAGGDRRSRRALLALRRGAHPEARVPRGLRRAGCPPVVVPRDPHRTLGRARRSRAGAGDRGGGPLRRDRGGARVERGLDAHQPGGGAQLHPGGDAPAPDPDLHSSAGLAITHRRVADLASGAEPAAGHRHRRTRS